jgi:hypothetical protein
VTQGVRHLLGAIAGAVLTPVIFLLILYGTDRLARAFQVFELDSAERYLGAFLVVLAAVAVGFLTTSLISPVGSLVSGLMFIGLGLWELVDTGSLFDVVQEVLPDRPERAFLTVSVLGMWLFIGVVLLVSSVSPSRWRSKSTPDRLRPGAPSAAYAGAPSPPGSYQPWPAAQPTAPPAAPQPGRPQP